MLRPPPVLGTVARLQSNVSPLATLNWVTPCTFPTCKYVASYVAVDKECRRLFTCVLVSPKFSLCMSHCPFPPHISRCVWPAPIWRNTSTFDSSLISAFCGARAAVGEPAQGVDSGGLLCYCTTYCSGLINTCMILLLPEAMAHINCKHTISCMQKIAQKNNMLFMVTSIHFGILNPVHPWYCRYCVGDRYKLLSVMRTHLPTYSSQLHSRC